MVRAEGMRVMVAGGRRAAIAAAVACLLLLCGAAESAEAAQYRTVPGSSKRVGSGTTYRFTVEVQRSIRINRKRLAQEVEDVLFHRRSWTRSGSVAFRRVDRRGDTRLILAKAREVDRLCRPLPTNGRYSCSIGRTVVLNVRRWRTAVPHWRSSRRNYRRMLVNHEMGHRIGHVHRGCPGRGRRAPVMQQQSIGLQGCRPGWWPRKRELRRTRGASLGASAIAALG